MSNKSGLVLHHRTALFLNWVTALPWQLRCWLQIRSVAPVSLSSRTGPGPEGPERSCHESEGHVTAAVPVWESKGERWRRVSWDEQQAGGKQRAAPPFSSGGGGEAFSLSFTS